MPRPAVVMSVVVAVIALVVAGVLLSRGGEQPAAAPNGYTTFSASFGGHTVRFAYPRAWGAVERKTEQGVQIIRILGPRAGDGAPSVVRLTADPDTTASFDVHYGLIDGNDRLQLRNVREISKQDVDVPGAEQARRRVLEYDLKRATGVQRSRSSTIFALADDGLFVNLLVDTPADKPDVDAGAVLGSLTLDG